MNDRGNVLLVGVDPTLLDLSRSAWRSDTVRGAGKDAVAELEAEGFAVRECVVDLGDTAAAVLEAELRATDYDCVMIGNGVRSLPQNFALFEQLVNVVHRHAPRAVICFNTNPGDTADAVRRAMG